VAAVSFFPADFSPSAVVLSPITLRDTDSMSVTLDSTDRALLLPYVTNLDGSVYALQNLPEEVVAVLFAYYSRSRESLRDNLLRLIKEGDLALARPDDPLPGSETDTGFLARAADKARAFHEKWVVGYGHSSVAEHAVVHLAIEDVSILASKVIEDARLASYTEKSTRYVPFDTSRHHTPAAFSGKTPAAGAWRQAINSLMTTYDSSMPRLVDWFVANHPPKEGQGAQAHLAACRAQACDVLRYLLPAATQTNLGLTANARVLEAMLSRLLSHPLAEVREIGGRMKAEALRIVPTLIKYAEPTTYRAATSAAMRERAALLFAGRPAAAPDTLAPARLVRWDVDAEERVCEAILAGASNRSAEAVRAAVTDMTTEARRELLADYVSRRGRHDPPLRSLEATTMTFEIVVDYGAWRDLQRHRLMSVEEQPLTPELGYERPEILAFAGLDDGYDQAMEIVREAWPVLASESFEDAAYVIPLAFRKRAFLTLNLRQLHHLIQLRSARQGHASYRRVAQAMHAEFDRVQPALASAIRVDRTEYDLSRG